MFDWNDSQNELAITVYNKFSNKLNGTFIEVGAYDGVTSSNTYLLEKNNNWKGLLIEPSPMLYKIIQNNRNKSIIESCAVSNFEGTIYGDFDGHPMSSINGLRRIDDELERKFTTVPCTSLTTLCKKHKLYNIDLCSIDVEGNEYAVLLGIDFNLIQIKNFVIEVYTHSQDEIFNFLNKKGYNKSLCLTNYSKTTHPNWDGTLQDYLFTKE